jgi:hypothetical protein
LKKADIRGCFSVSFDVQTQRMSAKRCGVIFGSVYPPKFSLHCLRSDKGIHRPLHR